METLLATGQTMRLTGEVGRAPDIVRVDLAWDTPSRKSLVSRAVESLGVGGKSAVSLEGLAILFDDQGELIDTVWREKLYSSDGFVEHLGSGDDRNNASLKEIFKRDILEDIVGKGRAGVQSITIDLTRLPRSVEHVVFAISAQLKDDMARIENTHWSIRDEQTGKVIAQYKLSVVGQGHNSRTMARLSRDGSDGWAVTGIGDISVGRNINDFVSAARRHIC